LRIIIEAIAISALFWAEHYLWLTVRSLQPANVDRDGALSLAGGYRFTAEFFFVALGMRGGRQYCLPCGFFESVCKLAAHGLYLRVGKSK
jgi:hypothetical protein